MPKIVTVSVSQQVASAPSKLQQTGAFVSQGGTNLVAGSTALITQVSDLTAILNPSLAITAIVWAAGVVTVTTASAHGVPVGTTLQGTISACSPIGYNGNYPVTATSTTQLTYPLVSNPGAIGTLGRFQIYSAVELQAMATTFFAQGSNLAVYVLELGAGTTAAGVTALTAYIVSPTIQFYSYLLPAAWDSEPTAVAMAHAYTGTTAQTYFYVTTTLSTYTNWTGLKSVFATVQAPTAPANEFSAAAMFWVTLNYNPNSTNLASPLSFTYIYGVTAYTLTPVTQTALKAAGVNWVGNGYEGGISNTLILWGQYMDLNPFNYWYSVDWLSINVAEALAAAIINGSNIPTNPLYYNQAGINVLLKTAQATVANGISFGLILSPAQVTAVDFNTYVAQNPGDYATGTYNGLACTFVPARGFTSITIYLTASNIPSA